MSRLRVARLQHLAGRLWRRPGPEPRATRWASAARRCTAGVLPTRTFRRMTGKEGGDDRRRRRFRRAGLRQSRRLDPGPEHVRAGARALAGRELEGLVGRDAALSCPVFVLTHHAGAPLEMEGGTIFHFVTGGIEEALERAREAAGGKDVRVGGGAATIRQYLRGRAARRAARRDRAGPARRGEALFAGLDLPALGYVGARTPWPREAATRPSS